MAILISPIWDILKSLFLRVTIFLFLSMFSKSLKWGRAHVRIYFKIDFGHSYKQPLS